MKCPHRRWMSAVVLSLVASSCCSLFCPEDDSNGGDDSSAQVGPTPGANCQLNVSTVTAGQPTLWVAWNLDGNVTIGSPPTHTIWLGSSLSNFIVGGAPASTSISEYLLVITNLTGTTPSAKLKTSAGDPGTNVTVTHIDMGSETFAVDVRATNPPSEDLLLVVTAPGGGVKILLEDA